MSDGSIGIKEILLSSSLGLVGTRTGDCDLTIRMRMMVRRKPFYHPADWYLHWSK
jgi:hypothetical protein